MTSEQDISFSLGEIRDQLGDLSAIVDLLGKVNTAVKRLTVVSAIIPTLYLSESPTTSLIPVDRYYVDYGRSNQPNFIGGTNQLSLANWETTEKRFYMRTSSGAGIGYIGLSGAPFAYYGGQYGVSTSYAPKSTAVTTLTTQFRARFNGNADYTVHGVGFSDYVSGTATFVAANRAIQVLRNVGSWELGTSDGTTVSQTAGGTADGNWHTFKIEWTSADVKLYVDGTLTVTKTTNLPDKPMGTLVSAPDNTNTVDILDQIVSWS